MIELDPSVIARGVSMLCFVERAPNILAIWFWPGAEAITELEAVVDDLREIVALVEKEEGVEK